MSPRTLRHRLAVVLASAGAATLLATEVRAQQLGGPDTVFVPLHDSICIWRSPLANGERLPDQLRLCRNACRWGWVDAIGRKGIMGGLVVITPCDRLKPEEKEI